MSAVSRFEDLTAWQKARVLTRDVYVASRTERFRSDYGLAGQIQRAAVSVMANVAEGFARGGAVEFQRFLDIAFGSCIEVQSHLYVALDVGYLTQADFDGLKASCEEVGRLVLSLKRGNAAANKPPVPRTSHFALRTAPSLQSEA